MVMTLPVHVFETSVSALSVAAIVSQALLESSFSVSFVFPRHHRPPKCAMLRRNALYFVGTLGAPSSCSHLKGEARSAAALKLNCDGLQCAMIGTSSAR